MSGWSFVVVILLALSSTSAEARTINFAWNASNAPNLAGYRLLSGTQPGVYTQTLDVGNTLSGQLNLADGQTFYITVKAYDTAGVMSVPSNEVFTALSIANPGNQVNGEGDAVALQLSGSTLAGRVLTFSATGLPPLSSVNGTTGAITGPLQYTAAGVYATTVSVADGSGATASASFSWSVSNRNGLPRVTNPGEQTNVVGQTVSKQIASSDPDGDALTLSAAGLPSGLSINATSGLISGTAPATAGSYSVTVTANDGNGGSGNTVFGWTITGSGGTNHAPVMTSPGNQVSAEGNNVSLTLTATDVDGGTLTFSATGLPPGLSLNATTGKITGLLSSTSSGNYSVTASVSDGALSNSKTFAWTVQDVPANGLPVVTDPGPRSKKIGGTVGWKVIATDPDGNDLTFSATGLPTGLTINPLTGRIHGTVGGPVKTYNVTVSVSDGSGTTQVSFVYTIKAA